MITTKKEYSQTIISYGKFINWFSKDFLKQFSKATKELNHSLNIFMQHYYKEIMIDITCNGLLSINKSCDDILKSMKKLRKYPYSNVLNKIVKDTHYIEQMLHFWYGKFLEFQQLIKHKFNHFDPRLVKAIENIDQLLQKKQFNDKNIGDLFDEYVHLTSFKDNFDTKPMGRLILALEYLRHSGDLSQELIRSLKKYSVEEEWNPGIVIKNKYGKYRPVFYFHIYIHHIYKTDYLDQIFQKKLGEDVQDKLFRDLHHGGAESQQKLAQYRAVFKMFREDINEFTQLLLHYSKSIIKIVYLLNSKNLIRADFLDINYCARDLTSYGAACDRNRPPNEVMIVDSINNLLYYFALFCVEFCEKNKLFEEMSSYQIGRFSNNVPNIANWDYTLNKPQIQIKRKELAKLLEGYFSSINNKVPKLYGAMSYAIMLLTHEITHHFDRVNNPQAEKEVQSIWGMVASFRVLTLIQFICDLRSDAITQWRDAQLFRQGKQLHPIFNGIIFSSNQFNWAINQAKAKIEVVCSPKATQLDSTLGRIFGNEYYAIGKQYMILRGIQKSIEKEIPYFIYTQKGRKLSKQIQVANKERLKSFGRYLNFNELDEAAVDEIVRSKSIQYYQKLYQSYRRPRDHYLKDIEFYLPKYQQQIFELRKLEIEKIEGKNKELELVLKKMQYVSYHYLQKIGLIYWQLEKHEKSSAEYKKLWQKYVQLREVIIQKKYIFNFITRRIETRMSADQQGEHIMGENMFNSVEIEKLVKQEKVNKILIDHSYQHKVGRLLKKLIFFPAFNKRIVEEVFAEVHEMNTSSQFFNMMKELDKYFKVPHELQLFSSEKELREKLKRAAEEDFLELGRKGFELSKEEIKKYFSNISK